MHRKDGHQVKYKEFAFKADAVNDDGTFSGYGSVFGIVDCYNEVVAKGAFTESLAEILAKGRPLPALWQHNSGEPVGGYNDLEEDDKGLRVGGFLLKDDVVRAREAHALMKAGVVSGLSIGYFVRNSSYDEKTGIRTLNKLDLVEVSIVTFPANDAARVDAIKSKLAHGSLPTMPEFEQLLREAGFSKSQSAVIANRGLKHLLDRSESGGEEGNTKATLARMSQALCGFSLPEL